MSEDAGEQKPRRLRLSKEIGQPENTQPSEQTAPIPPAETPPAPAPSEPAAKPSLKFKRAAPTPEPTPEPAPQAPSPPPVEPATPPPPSPIKANEIGSSSNGGLNLQKPPPQTESQAAPPPLPRPTPQPQARPQTPRGPSSGSLNQAFDEIDSGGKKKSFLPIVVILLVLLVVGGCGYGIWYVLGGLSAGGSEEIALEETSVYSSVLKEAEEILGGSGEMGQEVEVESVITEEEINEEEESMVPEAEPVIEIVETTSPEEQKEITDFLAGATYGGVRAGPAARVVINKRSYQIGDEIQEIAGLVFVGTKDGQLVFKDKNGIVYTKRF